jgi:hypothetical protein
MLKLIPPGSYDFGGEPMVQLVKVSSRGIIGDDRQQLLKRASESITHKLGSLRLQPGEVPVHIIALGTTETVGPNRNGDGFRNDICERYHDTFTKHARYFRNHRNNDVRKSYGIPKLSAFNAPMGRIELIAVLNATKEAADRNGGLIADIEIEKLARGDDVPTSMGCRVSNDECSGCGHKARYRSEYCDASICTKYGGLKHNLSRTYADGHTLHADNPDPDFFDISSVCRNADRISFNLGVLDGYDHLVKAASAAVKLGGAALADSVGMTTPTWLAKPESPWASTSLIRQLKIAGELIAREDKLQQRSLDLISPLSLAFRPEAITDVPAVSTGVEKLASAMAATHSAQCLLPLTPFLQLVTGWSPDRLQTKVAAVAAALPGMFNRLVSADNFERRLQDNPYLPTLAASRETSRWAVKYAGDWSLDRERIVERLQRSSLQQRQPTVPQQKYASHAGAAAEKLAEEYALYELAFLASQPESPDQTRLYDLVVHANYLA